jgi:hypothetical protein
MLQIKSLPLFSQASRPLLRSSSSHISSPLHAPMHTLRRTCAGAPRPPAGPPFGFHAGRKASSPACCPGRDVTTHEPRPATHACARTAASAWTRPWRRMDWMLHACMHGSDRSDRMVLRFGATWQPRRIGSRTPAGSAQRRPAPEGPAPPALCML